MKKRYVQYGCGLSAPNNWLNFDSSPTLRIQQFPFLGKILKKRLNVIFPENVIFGDIIKGLPIQENSCDGLYCSHTLEHLSLEDFRIALKNSFKILKNGGIFRCIVPDLQYNAIKYLKDLENNDDSASINFMINTYLGINKRPKKLKDLIISFYKNSAHLWMWDSKSLSKELINAGFSQIRICKFNDCEDKMFNECEDLGRFENAVAIECRK
jgi:SAM-dependent methyltransferase